MQKWEYLYVQAYKNDVCGINGKHVSKIINSLPGYLSKLGEECWELVGVSPSSEDANYWILVFKRPKE